MDATHHALSVEQILERQARLWQLRRTQEKEKERPGRGRFKGMYFGPYVLISRELGSGGRAVGALLAERLKWQVFDRQIVDEIARHAKSVSSSLKPWMSTPGADWKSSSGTSLDRRSLRQKAIFTTSGRFFWPWDTRGTW